MKAYNISDFPKKLYEEIEKTVDKIKDYEETLAILGKNDFGMTREGLRQRFVEIRKNPDVIQLDNTRFQDAADRGNYLEDGLLQWVSDKLDKLAEGGSNE